MRRLFFCVYIGVLIFYMSFVSYAQDINNDKMKLYVELYPDLFVAGPQLISNRMPVAKTQTVSLLLKSFNDSTDYQELSAVLHPTDHSADQSVMKSDSELVKLLEAKGLSWQEYQDITHQLATNPTLFQSFYKQVNKFYLKRKLSGVRPDNVQTITNPDQQILVNNLMSELSKAQPLH